MDTKNIISAACVLAASTVFCAAPASAGDWFSAKVGVATENVGKGLGKSDGEPSLNGTVTASHGDFFASFGGSTVDIAAGADVEWVSAVGYAPEVAGFELEFAALYKVLDGSARGYDNEYWEYEAEASRSFGRVSVTALANYSPDGSGGTEEAWWLQLGAGFKVDRRTQLTAALGERITEGGTDYTAWNVGVKRKLADPVTLDVRWYDTDGHEHGDRYDGRLVGALSFSF